MIREFAISLAVLNSCLLGTFWVKNSEYTGPTWKSEPLTLLEELGQLSYVKLIRIPPNRLNTKRDSTQETSFIA